MRDDTRLRARLAQQWVEDPHTGCHVWAGHKNQKGYGRISRGGRLVSAHRLAWEFARGPIPCGAWILHRCDNPTCVNVDHLFMGDNDANVADKVAKGRQSRGVHHSRSLPHGEDRPNAKLTNAMAGEIRSAYAQGGVSQAALGARYGVTQAVIHRIVRGKGYVHAAP